MLLEVLFLWSSAYDCSQIFMVTFLNHRLTVDGVQLERKDSQTKPHAWNLTLGWLSSTAGPFSAFSLLPKDLGESCT